ncbi:NADP(H)-dependent aldo-keto reductase [Thalassobaculum sp. OXR-137]|uniref:NADP(H)-dependent aldo-keto reductase n=1 Tax=Thalassobaculum sp. OXR-137 TaxID=3100173 RepID=UPI002AC9A261|nr:NADP(H)-dependent aldo-keto reductase [Thalassobaculum sp. OXR-137]WPZ35075.1 NADP(H)-dependent aldo-keto reductase [Thalassobaculum sp. OXR-137]
MQYRPLGRTGLNVSLICLGTMTYGKQNTEAEGHAQMDLALDRGINFFDTAEMYAVPPTAETYGKTEEVIGTWFAARGNRDKVILATKAVGPGERFKHVRDGSPKFDAKNLTQAVDDSLKRLRTDYIDLYQLHWPERSVNSFGKLGYVHNDDEVTTPIAEQLFTLATLVKAGKIRHIGLSNETPWGMMTFARLADEHGLPRVASVQNPYSLLNRSFEVGCAEVAIREDIGLLAYSPLASGWLTGKYQGGARPEGARMTLFPDNFSRYSNDAAQAANAEYVQIARDNGLDPAQMALAYVNTRRFMTANIIGATKMDQLEANIASLDVTLSEAVLEAIEDVQRRISNPGP